MRSSETSPRSLRLPRLTTMLSLRPMVVPAVLIPSLPSAVSASEPETIEAPDPELDKTCEEEGDERQSCTTPLSPTASRQHGGAFMMTPEPWKMWPVCSANARGLLPGKLARKNNRPHFLNMRQAEDTAARLTLGG
jgi:hypothetical protein